MQANIAEANIQRTDIQQVNVGEVQIGSTSIQQLVLRDMHVGMHTGAVRLRDLRVNIGLSWAIDWSVHVTVDVPDWLPGIPDELSFSYSGTIPLPGMSITVPFGDVDLAGLSDLSLDIAQFQANNLTAAIAPLTNLQLGPMIAEQIRARNVVAPLPPMQLSGMGLTRLMVQGLTVPGASLGDVSIGHAGGGRVPIASVGIPGFSLPATSAGSMQSNNLDVQATSNPYEFPADAGVLKLTLHLTPSAGLHMARMEMDNIQASASIGRLEMANVVLPFDVFNLTLQQLGITQIGIPSMEVA